MSGIRLQLGALLTCLGDLEPTWQGVISGDTAGLTRDASYLPEREVKVGKITATLHPLPAELSQHDCRIHRILYRALKSLKDRIDLSKIPSERLAVVLGSSTAGIAATEEDMLSASSDALNSRRFHFMKYELGGLASFAAEVVGAEGPVYTISTACSSSAKIFSSARRLLLSGEVDGVLVGGVDSLCRLTVNGFNALSLLSRDIPNPLSRNRDGIVIGEGAALFLMTREVGGVQLLGIGESSDAYHMSTPHPEGKGAEIAMREALEEARCTAEEISYINLHATGTKHNDLAESIALSAVFGDGVRCSSTKPITGHTLGAGGAIEAALCSLVLEDGRLPPHVWDGVRDEELRALRLVLHGETLGRSVPMRVVSNSFAFGGSNCVLVLGHD